MNGFSWLLVLCALVLFLSPWGGPAIALLLGVLIGLTAGNPIAKYSSPWSKHILAAAIVALGAGMDLAQVASVGAQGFVYTLFGLLLAFALARVLASAFALPLGPSLLLTSGTAICGGSAIAAVATVLKSRDSDVAIAIACVFLLNAVALVCFPPIGHWFGLSQHQFGLWAALAIHDTSSVVGAAAAYGPEALSVATAAKLARALWIVPLALILGALVKLRTPMAESSLRWWQLIPWFIPAFVLASVLCTVVGELREVGRALSGYAKPAFSIALFLIGLGLKRETLRQVGASMAMFAIVLWLALAGATLGAILLGWIA